MRWKLSPYRETQLYVSLPVVGVALAVGLVLWYYVTANPSSWLTIFDATLLGFSLGVAFGSLIRLYHMRRAREAARPEFMGTFIVEMADRRPVAIRPAEPGEVPPAPPVTKH